MAHFAEFVMDDLLARTRTSFTLPAPWYAAIVMGLTLFLTMLILFPEPIEYYEARTVVQQQVGVEASASSLPLTTEQADAVLASLTSRPGQVAWTVESQVTAHQQPSLMISARGRWPGELIRESEVAARKLIESQPAAWDPFAKERRAREEDLTRRLRLAQESEAACDEELGQLQRDRNGLAFEGPRTNDSPAGPVADEATVRARQRLQSRLLELTAQREELLVRWTEDHPVVKNIANEMAQATSELAQLSPREEQSSLPEFESDHEEQTRERWQTLVQQKNEARQRWQSLRGELTALLQTPQAYPLKTWIEQPPTLIGRQGGEPSLARVLVLALLAAMASCAVLVADGWLTRPSVITRNEITSELRLPIVSALRLTNSSTHLATPSALPQFVYLCEFCLAFLVLSFLLAFATSDTLSTSSHGNPLGSVAEVLDRVHETMLRR